MIEVPIASVTIEYGLTASGAPDVRVQWDGDDGSALVTLLGMLRMAEDTIIRDAMGEIDD